MAAFPPKDKLVTRRPSLKGLVMMDVSNGAERTRAWPRKRGKNLPPAQKERMEWFRQAQWATKYMEPAVMVTFANATKGTPLLPRDLATMMFAGRFTTLILEGGRKVFSVQQMQDVSFSLDAIGQTVGTQLIRGPVYWEAVPQITGNRVGAIVTRAAATASFASNITGIIPFTAESVDQGFFWDIAQPTRIVIPALGWYNMLFRTIRTSGGNTTSMMSIFKNGVSVYSTRLPNPNSSSSPHTVLPFMDYAAAGDYFEFAVVTFGAASTWTDSSVRIVGNA